MELGLAGKVAIVTVNGMATYGCGARWVTCGCSGTVVNSSGETNGAWSGRRPGTAELIAGSVT